MRSTSATTSLPDREAMGGRATARPPPFSPQLVRVHSLMLRLGRRASPETWAASRRSEARCCAADGSLRVAMHFGAGLHPRPGQTRSSPRVTWRRNDCECGRAASAGWGVATRQDIWPLVTSCEVQVAFVVAVSRTAARSARAGQDLVELDSWVPKSGVLQNGLLSKPETAARWIPEQGDPSAAALRRLGLRRHARHGAMAVRSTQRSAAVYDVTFERGTVASTASMRDCVAPLGLSFLGDPPPGGATLTTAAVAAKPGRRRRRRDGRPTSTASTRPTACGSASFMLALLFTTRADQGRRHGAGRQRAPWERVRSGPSSSRIRSPRAALCAHASSSASHSSRTRCSR